MDESKQAVSKKSGHDCVHFSMLQFQGDFVAFQY